MSHSTVRDSFIHWSVRGQLVCYLLSPTACWCDLWLYWRSDMIFFQPLDLWQRHKITALFTACTHSMCDTTFVCNVTLFLTISIFTGLCSRWHCDDQLTVVFTTHCKPAAPSLTHKSKVGDLIHHTFNEHYRSSRATILNVFQPSLHLQLVNGWTHVIQVEGRAG